MRLSKTQKSRVLLTQTWLSIALLKIQQSIPLRRQSQWQIKGRTFGAAQDIRINEHIV